MNTKRCSAFIQTDKAIFKPKDLVQFRVLLLDRNTKPCTDSSVELYITDGDQNRIKQFSDVKFHKGVYQSQLQLSDSPVLGDWNIHVKVNKAKDAVKKQFEVAEYVLPKIELIVDSKPNVVLKDGKIQATVRAKYTYGKLAVGHATVTAKIDGGKWEAIKKTVEVDGKKVVEFEFENELKMVKEFKNYASVKIDATFTDKLSGKTINGSTKVKVQRESSEIKPYAIELTKSVTKFNPGLPFKLTAVIKNHDGVPISDASNQVEFVLSHSYQIDRMCSYERNVRREGSNKLTYETEVYNCPDYVTHNKTYSAPLKDGLSHLDVVVTDNSTFITAYVSLSNSMHAFLLSNNFLLQINYLGEEETIHVTPNTNPDGLFLQVDVQNKK